MAYAMTSDVQARLTRALSDEEQVVCSVLLEDAALLIDSYGTNASEDVKRVVSCRMVARAIDDVDSTIPMGATQGSMSGLGYYQSWTIGPGSGGTGELWVSKAEKQMLGAGNKIGSYSPIEELVVEAVE